MQGTGNEQVRLEAEEELAPRNDERPSVQELMARIRDQIRADFQANIDKRKVFAPYLAEGNGDSQTRAGDLLHSNKLLYLNQYCSKSEHFGSDHFQSHRPGLIGRIVTKVKRRIHLFLFQLLDRYFTSEREFQGKLVQYLNDTARYIDARDMSNFWELIRKIDYDVQKALDRIERIADEQMGTLRTQEKWVNELVRESVVELKETVNRHASELKTLDSVARGLEGVIARLESRLPLHQATPSHQATVTESRQVGDEEAAADYSYLLLENRYRGSEEEIASRLAIYPAFFTGASLPVLEIGPGRGELLSLFSAAGVPAYGVDLDAAMVQAAVQRGCDARLGDGLSHLRSLPPQSLGGVIGVQVVEHLTRTQLKELFDLCRMVVAPGGRVIFETINPRSMIALSSNYFRDPTHVWPLHPDTLEYSMNLAGLRTVEVRFLSPFPAQGMLRSLGIEEYMSPRLAHTIQTINRNFSQLNDLLFGYQDYCIVAEVPPNNG